MMQRGCIQMQTCGFYCTDCSFSLKQRGHFENRGCTPAARWSLKTPRLELVFFCLQLWADSWQQNVAALSLWIMKWNKKNKHFSFVHWDLNFEHCISDMQHYCLCFSTGITPDRRVEVGWNDMVQHLGEQLNLISRLMRIAVRQVHSSCAAAFRVHCF